MNRKIMRLSAKLRVLVMCSLVCCSMWPMSALGLEQDEPDGPMQQPLSTVSMEVYVSPSGSDTTGDGTFGSPYRTIGKAKDEVRLFLSVTPEGLRRDVTVTLRGGTYFLDETLEFDAEDSGSSGNPVIYQAYPGETPIISGGRVIGGWQTVSENVYKASVPGFDFRQLYIDDIRGVRARTPNEGGFYRVLSYDTAAKTIKIEAAETTGLTGGAGTAEMVVQTHWTDRHMLVESVQTADGIAVVTPAEPERSEVIGNPNPLSEPGQSYHFENKLAFLDEPGEWFLDKQQEEVYYMPRPGEQMSTAVAIVPQLETLVRLAGTLEEPVQHIHFKGLTFTHATWLKPNDGYAPVQSTYYPVDGLWYGGKLPGAVMLEATGHIRFERNTFTRLGATGLDMVYGNFDNEVVGNVFTDISGNGLAVGSQLYRVVDLPEDPDMFDRRMTIDNNFVYRIGQDYKGASGIYVGYAEETTVTHNELLELPYTGISVGWGFTLTDTPLKNQTIAYNRISKAVNLLDDGGGIYTLSYQPGTVIKENYISDLVRSPWTTVNYPDKEWWKIGGIYQDQNSSGMSVTNNVVLNVERRLKTNKVPYGGNVYLRNYNDQEAIKVNAGLSPAYQDIRLAVAADPPADAPDVDPPELVSAETDETGEVIRLVFTEPLTVDAQPEAGVLDAADFQLSGTDAVVVSAVIDDADPKSATVILSLDEPIGYGKSIQVTMEEGAVHDITINAVEETVDFAVTNLMLIPYLMDVGMTGSTILHTGESAWLHVQVKTRGGLPVDLSTNPPSFSSQDAAIAAAGSADGVVTGRRPGEARVRISVTVEDIPVEADVAIMVVAAAESKPDMINIAAGKPASATNEYSPGTAADRANDNNPGTMWASAATGSLTIDLGEQGKLYRIKQIEVVTRQSLDQPLTRSNFAVWGSDDPKFASYTVLGSQGNEPLPYQSVWSVNVEDNDGFRYVRFEKQRDYAAVAELRVWAEPLGGPDEIFDISVVRGDGELEVYWEETGDERLDTVEIYEGGPTDDGNWIASVSAGVQSVKLPNLTNGTPYTYTFRTAETGGVSSFGRTVTAAPAALTNKALGASATATSQYSATYSPDKAVDNLLSTLWTTTGTASMTVDLGGDYRNHLIRKVDVVTRHGVDQPSTRRNFEVRASNDPAFATYTVLGSQGEETLPYEAIWSVDVDGETAYRYVRFVKPVNYAAVAELRVWTSPIAATEEVNDAKAYTQDGALYLAWEEQPDNGLKQIRIYDGTSLMGTVNRGLGSVLITGLANDTTHTLTIKTVGPLGNESAGVAVTGTPRALANIASGATAGATEEYSSSFTADKAIDDNINTAWISSVPASLTLDLGTDYDDYRIRKIEFVTRQGADQPSTRRNFEVQASNDPNFATYTVLGSQGNESIPHQSTWSAYVPADEGYRYIRFAKPVNYASVAELRVFAES